MKISISDRESKTLVFHRRMITPLKTKENRQNCVQMSYMCFV